MPPPGASGDAALPGTAPFIMHSDGMGWIWVAEGLKDGPLPAHYEPLESPLGNPSTRSRSIPRPTRRSVPDNPYAESPGDDRYPCVLTTYRLTEHHTAGGMTRYALASRRAPAGAVLRDLSRARGGGRGAAWRGRHDLVAPRLDRGARARHRADAAVARGRPDDPSGRPSLSLGPSRAGAWRCRQRSRRDFRGTQRQDHGIEGARLPDRAVTTQAGTRIGRTSS